MLPLSARAEEPLVQAALTATLSETGDKIFGTITYTWTNRQKDAQTQIALWLYPNRFRKPNPHLDAGMLKWIYPAGKASPGNMEIFGAKWNGHPLSDEQIRLLPLDVPNEEALPDVIAQIALPAPLPSGEIGRLTVSFKLDIPKRRGRFGRYKGTISLGGGWYPVLMSDFSGQDTTLAWEAVNLSAKISLPAEKGAVLHDAVFPIEQKPRHIKVDNIITESLVLVVMKRMEISKRDFSWGTAIHVHPSLSRHEPTWKEAARDNHGVPEALPQPGRFDYSERLFNVVKGTAEAIRAIAPKAKLAKRVVFVDIPSWDRLVQPGFGPILLSDRLWRLVPVKDGLFFHDSAVVRSLAPTLVFDSALRAQPLQHRFIVADLIGVFFSDYYSKTVHNRLRTIEEIIGFARIFPTIDNLLYAPQIPFREVYFRSCEEPEPLRDEPWMFMNRLPRGKRILAKLEEQCDRTKIFDSVRYMLEKKQPFDDAVANLLREAPSRFFKDWTGPYPAMNYRLGKIQDTLLDDGQYRHEAEIIRDGEIVQEKVTVRITDKDGLFTDRVWNKAESRTVLEWTSHAPVAKVEIDPDIRLVESPALTPDHPRRDNISPLPWRPPMFTRLVVWGDLTSGEPYVDLGFWLRRKYDNTNIFSLSLDYTTFTWGGAFSYLRFFGNKRTLNARTWYLGPTVSAVRYREVNTSALHLSENIRQSSVMGAIGISLGRDTRAYSWDPMSGSSIAVSATYAAGASADGELRQMGKISLRGGKLFSFGIHHTVALFGGAAFVLGNPTAAAVTSLSDRTMLRGFDSDETFGRIGLYAVLEYRHTLFNADNLTAPLYSWFDRFQGALFVAGGTVSKPSGTTDGIFTPDRIFTEIGYGLRIHLLFLGVHQYLLCFDLAVPLTPTQRIMEETLKDGSIRKTDRGPYKIIFGITQTF